MNFRYFWFFGLIISAYLGVALSYSKIYLIHLFLAFSPFFFYQSFSSSESLTNFIKKNWGFFFWFFYLLISVTWAAQTRAALTYNVMVLLGILTALPLTSNSQKTKLIFKVLGILSVISMAVGLLESLTPFRYPISKYSTYLEFFKKSVIGSDISESYPTSFFWTANNFAFILLISIPFFSLLKKRWQEVLLWLMSIFLILRTSSRGILALLALYLGYRLLHLLLQGKNKIKILLTLFIAFLIFVPVAYKSLSHDNILELKTVQDVLNKQRIFYSTLISRENMENLPRTRRDEMFYQTFKLWSDHKIFGAGAGQLKGKYGTFNGSPLDLATPHHYWMELLCYGGLVFIGVIFFWFSTILKRLYKIGSEDSKAAFEAFILFILAAPACSTLVYFFPAWLFLGLVNRMSHSSGTASGP